MNAPAIQGDLFAPAVEPEDGDTDSDSWCTPPEIVDIAHRLWPEGVSLDVCSNSYALALGFVRAKVAWTKRDDCLVQSSWDVDKGRTRLWLQPPYSRAGAPIIDDWARRWDAQELWETLALVRIDSARPWWKALDSRACSLVLFHERLAHYEAGQRKDASSFCSAMFLCTRASDPKVRHRALVAAVGNLGHVYH